jgi:exopolysaccharide biosynthesis protein
MRAVVFAAAAAVVVAAGVSSGSFHAQPKVQFTTDVDTQPLPAPNSSNGLMMKTFTGTSYGKSYTAHLATIDDPRYFRFEVSPGGLPHLSKPTVTAGFRNCEYATNGGFFDMSNGNAEGNVIVNGTVLASYDNFWTNLGITDTEFVVGYITQADLASYNFRTLLQGVGWLVRNGMGHVNVSMSNGEVSESFVNEMAPR